MDFKELAVNRYSCRKFSDKPVEDEKIDQILAAALAAPTAHNYQPFHIWVIREDEDIEKLGGVTKCTFGAPLFFVVGGRKDEGWIRSFDHRNYEDVDASIVATHMMLQIADLGLATTWVGNFNSWQMEIAFPEMSDYDLIAVFPVGYPARGAKPSEMHTKSKALDDVVTFITSKKEEAPAEEAETSKSEA